MAQHAIPNRATRWLHGGNRRYLAILSALAMVATMLVVFPIVAPKAKADNELVECAYALDGPFNKSICWFNFKEDFLAAARGSDGTTQIIDLGNGYKLETTLTVEEPSTTLGAFKRVKAQTWNHATFGAKGFYDFGPKEDTTVHPILYRNRSRGGKNDPRTKTSVKLTDTKAYFEKEDGSKQYFDYSLLAADAESTQLNERNVNDPNEGIEQIIIESDQPIRNGGFLTPNDDAYKEACGGGAKGWDENEFTCSGNTRDPVGTFLAYSVNPNSFKATLHTRNQQGIAVGVMMAEVKGEVEVRHGNYPDKYRDNFDLNVSQTNPDRVLGGTGTTAGKTPESVQKNVLVNPGGGPEITFTSLQKSEHGTNRYNPSWTCTRSYLNGGSRTVEPLDVTPVKDQGVVVGSQVTLSLSDEDGKAPNNTTCQVLWTPRWDLTGLRISKNVDGGSASEVSDEKEFTLPYRCTFPDDEEKTAAFTQAFPEAKLSDNVVVTRGNHEDVVGLAAGMTCEVSEEDANSPANLEHTKKWTLRGSEAVESDTETIELQSGSAEDNAVGAVNQYEQKMGKVTVKKIVEGEAGPIFAEDGRPYDFTYQCGTDGKKLTVEQEKNPVDGTYGQAQAPDSDAVPVPTKCTLQETTGLSKDEANKYELATQYEVAGKETATDQAEFQVPATVTVRNAYSFKRAPLSITRKVTGEAAGLMTEPATMNWSCELPGSGIKRITGKPVAIAPNRTVKVPDNIPVGWTCTVTETAPDTPANTIHEGGKKASVVIAPNSQESGNTAVVEDIYNYQLTHLQLGKTVVNSENLEGLPETFSIEYNCGTREIGAESIELKGSVDLSHDQTKFAQATGENASKVSDDKGMLIPKGATCSVSEESVSLPTGIGLETSFTSKEKDASEFTLTDDDQLVNVTNTFERLGSGLTLKFDYSDPQNVKPDEITGTLTCEDTEKGSGKTVTTKFSFNPADSEDKRSRKFTPAEAPVGYDCKVAVEAPGTERDVNGKTYEISQNISLPEKVRVLESEGQEIRLRADWDYLRDGKFKVKKQVAFTEGTPASDAEKAALRNEDYEVTASCTPPTSETVQTLGPISVKGDNTAVAEFENIPRGSTCTITETDPGNPTGFQREGDLPSDTVYVSQGEEEKVLTNTYSRTTANVVVDVTRELPGTDAEEKVNPDHEYRFALNCKDAPKREKSTTMKTDGPTTVTFENVPSGLQCQVTQNNVGPLTFGENESTSTLNGRTSWKTGDADQGDPLSVQMSQGTDTNDSGTFKSPESGTYEVKAKNVYTYRLTNISVKKILEGSDSDLALLRTSEDPNNAGTRTFVFDYTCEGPDTKLSSVAVATDADENAGQNPPLSVTVANDQKQATVTKDAFVPEGTSCTITEREPNVPAELTVTKDLSKEPKILTKAGPNKFTVTNSYKLITVPVINQPKIGDDKVIVTPAEGQTFKPGDKITITVGDKEYSYTVKDGDPANGPFEIPVDPFKGGETVEVTNTSNGQTANGDPKTVGVATPKVTQPDKGASTVKITPVDGQRFLKGDIIEVTIDGDTYQVKVGETVESGDELTFTLPDGQVFKGGEKISVSASNASGSSTKEGNTVQVGPGTPFIPATPAVGDDTVKITPKDGQRFLKGDIIEVTIDGDTYPVEVKKTVESGDELTFTLPDGKKFKGGEKISVVNTARGETAEGNSVTVGVATPKVTQPDKGASTVKITPVEGQRFVKGDTISVTIDGDTYQVKVKETVESGEELTFTLPDGKKFKGGEVISVKNTNKAGDDSIGNDVRVAPATPIVAQPEIGDRTLSVKVTENERFVEGDIITITVDGQEVTHRVTDQEAQDGALKVDLPDEVILNGGETISVTNTAEDERVAKDKRVATGNTVVLGRAAEPKIDSVSIGDNVVTVTPVDGQSFVKGDTIKVTVDGEVIEHVVTDEEAKANEVKIETSKPFAGGETVSVTNTPKGSDKPLEGNTRVVGVAKPIVDKPEIGDDTATVHPDEGQRFVPGDILTITIDGESFTRPVTKQEAKEGRVIVKLPGDKKFKGSENVSVSATNADNTAKQDGNSVIVDPGQPRIPAAPAVGTNTVEITPVDGHRFVAGDVITVNVDGKKKKIRVDSTMEAGQKLTFTLPDGEKFRGGETISVTNTGHGITVDGNEVTVGVATPVLDNPRAGDTSVTVIPTDGQRFVKGDTITITVNGEKVEHKVTADEAKNNKVVIGLDNPLTDGAKITVTNASAGGQVAPGAPVELPEKDKEKSPTPTIDGVERGGNNAVISGKVDAPDGSEVTITYVDKNGETKTVSVPVKDGAYRVELPENDIPVGAKLTAQVREEGKEPSDVTEGAMKVIPAEPHVSQPNRGDTELTVTPVEGQKFVAGNVLIITVDGKKYEHVVTADDVKNQRVIVPVDELGPNAEISVTNTNTGTDDVPGNTVKVDAPAPTSSSSAPAPTSSSSAPAPTSSSSAPAPTSSSSAPAPTSSSSAPAPTSSSSAPAPTSSSSAPAPTSSSATPLPPSGSSVSPWWVLVPAAIIPIVAHVLPKVVAPTVNIPATKLPTQPVPEVETTTTPQTVEPTTVQPQPSETSSPRGVLARTGVMESTMLLIIIGFFLMLGGAVLMVLRRRKQ